MSEGRAGPPPAAVLQERRRLPPLLQRGPPLLFPQPDHQVGSRDPSALSWCASGPRRHPAGPEGGRPGLDPPGTEPGAAGGHRGGPAARPGDRGSGLCRVLGSDPEEPEGRF